MRSKREYRVYYVEWKKLEKLWFRNLKMWINFDIRKIDEEKRKC